MSVWLELAHAPDENLKSLTDTLQKPSESTAQGETHPFLQVSTGCRDKKSEATPPHHQEPPETHEMAEATPFMVVSGGLVAGENEAASKVSRTTETPEFPYGTSPAGRPLTWTGKVVSLAEWRALSEWDKHGPDGRVWCAISREWIDPSEVQQ